MSGGSGAYTTLFKDKFDDFLHFFFVIVNKYNEKAETINLSD